MSYKTNTTTKVIRAQLEKPLADVGIDTNRHIERMQYNGRYQKLTIMLKSKVDVCICGKDKRIIYDVRSGALGDYCITIPVSVFTQKRIEYGRACPELQRTKGRRVVFISEPSHNETLNLGIIKEVTGGDAMYTRGLYEDGGEMQYEYI